MGIKIYRIPKAEQAPKPWPLLWHWLFHTEKYRAYKASRVLDEWMVKDGETPEVFVNGRLAIPNRDYFLLPHASLLVVPYKKLVIGGE